MAIELSALIALSADNLPITASLSPDTLAVFGYAYLFLSDRKNWLANSETSDDLTDDEWDVVQAMVDGAMREIQTNMVGQIIEMVTATLPPNMLECDGSVYLKSDYPLLYDAIDSSLVVDASHFRVPDMRGRVSIGVSSSHALLTAGGEESHALSAGEMPSHNHSANDAGHTHAADIPIPNLTTIGAGVPEPTAIPSIGGTGVGFANISIGSAGNDEPHNNMQPFIVVRKVIVAF